MFALAPTLSSHIATAVARHGDGAVRVGATSSLRKGVATGNPDVDALTGYVGLPTGQITILRGHGSSGKLGLGLAMLAGIQKTASAPVCCIDLAANIEAGAFAARGINAERLVYARPVDAAQALEMLANLLKGRAASVILLNSMAELLASSAVRRMWNETVAHLAALVRQASVPVIFLLDPTPLHTTVSAAADIASALQAAGVVLECRFIRSLVDDSARLSLSIEVKCTRSRFGTGGVARFDLVDA